MDTVNKIYYVYKWFFIDTGEIFHIGKGSGLRYKDKYNHRNTYFKNIVNKYKDNVSSEIMFSDMYEVDALALERKLIKEYKAIGWCKTNLHEGGCGGNTGNYDNPERSRKLREAGKKRTGSKNPMFGHKHTLEARKIIREANIGRKMLESTKEKLRIANTGRKKTESELEKLRNAQKGIPKPKDQYVKMMYAQCKECFLVFYEDKLIYSTISSNKFELFYNKYLKISSSIASKILEGNYVPKFTRNLWLTKIRITKKKVSDVPEEYLNRNEVEQFFLTDEIRSVLDNVQASHYIKTEKYKTHKNRILTRVS